MIGVFFPACQYLQEQTRDKEAIIARVQDRYLYYSDIDGLIGENVSESDSTELVNHYIETWVRRNLLLLKAEEVLPETDVDIEGKLEDYRESLVIFVLEQELTKRKLDTLVEETEIKSYYEQHKESFRLKDNLLKAKFVIVGKNAPKQDSIKWWLKKNKKEALQTYCEENANNYSLENKWYLFSNFTQRIPIKTSDPATFLRKNSFFQKEENFSQYYVKIDDHRIKGDIAPMEYKKEDIAKIIVNKRRIELIKKIKDEVYDEAINSESFEIY